MSAECLSLQEQLKQLESFKGKSISEVVCSLPTLPPFVSSEIDPSFPIRFNFVRYRLSQYRIRRRGETSYLDTLDEPDVPLFIDAFQGERIDLEKLLDLVEPLPGYAMGLTSKVSLLRQGENSPEEFHLPLMDFDFDPDGIHENEFMRILKDRLSEEIEMRGLILSSSGKPGHVHFLGIGRGLLPPRQFLTFLGMCGLIRTKDGEPLADSRFIFHALTAKKREIFSMRRFFEDQFFSIYDEGQKINYPDVYTTLCVKSSKSNWVEPKVIDIVF